MAVGYSELEHRTIWYMVIISENPAAFTIYCCPKLQAVGSRYCYCKIELTDSSETFVVACRTARCHPRRPKSQMSKPTLIVL
jgi:hypothetical protein